MQALEYLIVSPIPHRQLYRIHISERHGATRLWSSDEDREGRLADCRSRGRQRRDHLVLLDEVRIGVVRHRLDLLGRHGRGRVLEDERIPIAGVPPGILGEQGDEVHHPIPDHHKHVRAVDLLRHAPVGDAGGGRLHPGPTMIELEAVLLEGDPQLAILLVALEDLHPFEPAHIGGMLDVSHRKDDAIIGLLELGSPAQRVDGEVQELKALELMLTRDEVNLLLPLGAELNQNGAVTPSRILFHPALRADLHGHGGVLRIAEALTPRDTDGLELDVGLVEGHGADARRGERRHLDVVPTLGQGGVEPVDVEARERGKVGDARLQRGQGRRVHRGNLLLLIRLPLPVHGRTADPFAGGEEHGDDTGRAQGRRTEIH